MSDKITNIDEAREKRKQKHSYETVRVVEPANDTSVRIRFVIPGIGHCKWGLSRRAALELAEALRKAVYLREPSEIVQRYTRKRKA